MSAGMPRLLSRWWGWTKDRACLEVDAPEAGDRRITPSVFPSAAELMAREIPPVRWIVPSIVPEGVALLAGKPKLGKSWLALGLCVAVASGGVAFGTVHVEKGAALYLALEDNERRLQFRLAKILAGAEVPDGLHYSIECPRLDDGGVKAIEDWLRSRPDARLVVIDTLAKIRPRQRRGANTYQEDYEALEALLPLVARYNLAILVVHHLRKMAATDPLEEVNSSIGLTGGVDGVMILKRERTRADATLFVAGRDVEEEKEFALRWDQNTAGWALVGSAKEYRISQERAAILDLLRRSAPEPLGPKAIAEALDKPYSSRSSSETASFAPHDTASTSRPLTTTAAARSHRNVYRPEKASAARTSGVSPPSPLSATRLGKRRTLVGFRVRTVKQMKPVKLRLLTWQTSQRAMK